MSLIRAHYEQELQKPNRYYLRYYRTIKQARRLNQEIYADQTTKSKGQLKIQHPLRHIKYQSISDYHMSWLVGLLHDTKEDDFITYSERIEDVLKDLLPEQRKTVMKYIDQLTSDDSLTKGEKKRDQIIKMNTLELIPSWIRIFDKYDNCSRFLKDPVGKSKKEIQGYCAVAYLCYHRAAERFQEIRKNIQPEVKKLYDDICDKMGGLEKLRQVASEYIRQFTK